MSLIPGAIHRIPSPFDSSKKSRRARAIASASSLTAPVTHSHTISIEWTLTFGDRASEPRNSLRRFSSLSVKRPN
jgi:hypothetical protein